MTKRGGKRKGAGRHPDPIKKKRVTVSVPLSYEKEIRSKISKVIKAYIERCKREL